MKHPLTDAVCYEIGWNTQADYQDETDLMRAAADWQYEQVFQAWNQCVESDTDIQVILRFGQKLRAMRPTTQENN